MQGLARRGIGLLAATTRGVRSTLSLSPLPRSSAGREASTLGGEAAARKVVTVTKLLPDDAASLADELLYEDVTTSLEQDSTVAEKGEARDEAFQGETHLWQATKLVIFFQEDRSEEDILAMLSSAAATCGADFHKGDVEVADYEDTTYVNWKEAVADSFKPIVIDCDGKSIRVVPLDSDGEVAHVRPDENEDDVLDIFIQPCFAFGTGEHQTTAMCLRWLRGNQDILRATELPIVDYGAGSGILSIGALALGAGSVIATDIEEDAILAVKTNAERNGISESRLVPALIAHQDVLHGSVDAIGATDVLVANILLTPLLELEQTFARLVRPGGLVVLSGILRTQVPKIRARYSEHFEAFEEDGQDEWALLTAVRRQPN